MARKSKTYKRRAETQHYSGSYRKYYSPSSAAHEVYDDDSYESRVEKVGKRSKRKLKRHRGPRYIYNFGENPHSILIYSIITIIFLGCISCVFVYSFVWSVRRNVNRLEIQLKSLQEYNVTLEAGISASYDLFTIEERAVALGMASPQPHQIVYISVPKESYIEQYKPINEVETEMKLSNLREIFFGDR